MASTRFRDYSDNAIKYLLFHYETGTQVYFRVLNWLYQGKSPIECLVGDLTCFKKIILKGDEENNMVNGLENGTIDICDLNLALLYKITQSVCGLTKKSDQQWRKHDPSNAEERLEYLLFLLNDGQKPERPKPKNILEAYLEPILQEAGQRGDVHGQQIKDAISKMRDYYDLMYNDTKINESTRYNKCGAYVINTILPWLYQGLSPIKDLVIDLTKMKTIDANATQKKVLAGLKNISDLDISFQFQIIQSVCGLADKDKDVVWDNRCPVDKQDELEYLLFKLKDSRNDASHSYSEFKKNMTDLDFQVKSNEIESLLTSIIEKAGQRAKIDVRGDVTFVEMDIARIRNKDKIDAYMKSRILKQIFKDLKSSYKVENYENKMKGYSAPYLRSNNKDSIHLHEFLKFEESKIIVVQGETGEGKTSLTKFLFHSWLTGNTDSVEELSAFEVVLRVECNQISSRDISQFYESLFPNASFAFPNTNSLKKSFDEFEILWIMDGFDERTTEFKGFLTDMTKSLSEKHKLLITTRPNAYIDLKNYLGELSMTSLTLELLQGHNVEEIINNLIIGDERINQFLAHFNSRDDAAKKLLSTPLNFDLYIKLWMQDPKLDHDTYTTKMLFIKTIDHNLNLLPKRLDKHSDLTLEELEDSVKDWFYGSLCKQTFLLLMKQDIFIKLHMKEFLDILKKGARKFTQNTSICLSTFLVQRKTFAWENEEKFSYEFNHLTQQFILASLFIKYSKDYDGENAMNSINSYNLYIELSDRPSFEDFFIKFYVEMIMEDGSLVANSTKVFPQVKQMITRAYPYCINNQSYAWVYTSAAVKFHDKYMENVSQVFEEFPYLDIDDFENFLDLAKFLKFVHPQKIILSNMSSSVRQEGFQTLLDSLIESNIEIELQSISQISEKLVEFDYCCDPFTKFQNDSTLWVFCKQICLSIKYQKDFVELIKLLKDRKCIDFKQPEIWIDCDHLDRFINIIKDVEITTIVLTSLNIDNFNKVLELLNYIIKGEETLKFKALCHDFEDILATDKNKIQQIAHSVSLGYAHQSAHEMKELSPVMQRLEIWINCDSFFHFTDIIEKPTREMIEITTIGLTCLNIKNFKKVLEFLNKIKGEETLKFKALHHDFKDIPETDESSLQQIAHTVSIDRICQCKKYYLKKIAKLNTITSFLGTIEVLNELNDLVKTNLKSVFLFINCENEFRRILKFLHDYETNLSDVKIYLKCGIPEIKSFSFFEFTFPKDLVQHTTIYIDAINEEDHDDYSTFLNDVKGDKTLTFKAIDFQFHLSIYQRMMLDQIACNSSYLTDIYTLRMNLASNRP